jgi:hypothetical protein
MFASPVSGLPIDMRPPGGAEDMLLMEAAVLDRPLALTLLERLGDVSRPAGLCVHDFEAALLHLHGLVFGGRITADAHCRCGARVDIAFRTADFLAHRTPRRPRNVTPPDADGWYTLKGEDLSFRLPTIGDQIDATRETDPAAALVARCLRGASTAFARADRAMALLAPALSGPLQGVCPHCRETIDVLFDVPGFVLRELRVQASQICEHVHRLAGHYHWSEETILALPNWRRQIYVDRIAADAGGGA